MSGKKGATQNLKKGGLPVKRGNRFSEEANKFFLLWLNGASLETLINSSPFECDAKFPMERPHLVYLYREGYMGQPFSYAPNLEKEVLLFNSREDTNSARYAHNFTNIAIKGDLEFSKIEQLIKMERQDLRRIFDFYLDYKQFIKPILSKYLKRYKYLIDHWIGNDGSIALSLRNPIHNSIVEWIEINYILRTAVEPSKGILSGLRKCAFCGEFYFAGSDKSTFCSAKCRSKAYREKQKSLASEN